MNQSQTAIQFWIAEQTRKFESRLDSELSRIRHARDLGEIVRAVSVARSGADATIRATVGSQVHRFNVQAEDIARGLQDKALERYRALDAQTRHRERGRFIQDWREPCRGYFPNLCYNFDRAVAMIAAEDARAAAAAATNQPATPDAGSAAP